MKRALIVLKVVVSLALIAWVASQADFAAMSEAVAGAQIRLLLAAAAVHLVAYVLLNVRWWILLIQLVPVVGFRRSMPAFWLGLFGNNLLPSGIGGDVFKVVHLRSDEVSGRSLVASVLMDRAIGLLGVLLVGLLALLAMTGSALPDWNRWMIIALLIAIPIGIWVFFSRPIVAFLERQEARWSHRRSLVLGIHTLQQLQAFRLAIPMLFAALGVTVVLQSLVVVCYALLGLAIGAEVPIGFYFLTIPILFIAANLPISVGGLGVREGVFVALMTTLGMADYKAVGISVLYLAVMLSLTLPGGLLLMGGRGRGDQTPVRED